MIIQKLVPNFKKGRDGYKPEIVVIHIADGSLFGSYQEFLAKEKSSHYIVGRKGEVWQFVREEDTAWANGIVNKPTAEEVKIRSGINPNLYSISIEHEDLIYADILDIQYQTTAELVFGICKRWSIPLDRQHIIGHNEINSNKRCPENISIDRIITLAKIFEERKIEVLKQKQISLLQQILSVLREQLKKLLG